jgi:hypothetical protein
MSAVLKRPAAMLRIVLLSALVPAGLALAAGQTLGALPL